MPRLTVDGRPVDVPPGGTILDACRELAIAIPTLCYHPRLPLAGACRVCMVSVQGSRVLVPACARKAEEGMVVSTNDGAAHARRMVLELLLADHPSPCKKTLVPEGCELEDWARASGIRTSRFQKTTKDIQVDTSNKGIVFDPNACILCFRCVRACDDVQVNEVIGVQGRGFGSRIVFDMGAPMGDSSCVTCGECVQACPTGALVEQTVHALTEPVRPERVDTVCPYCGVGCQVTYEVVGNAVLRGLGKDGPANHGRLCVKGRFGYDYATHGDRLTVPLIRRDGVPKGPLASRRLEDVFRPASWDEALAFVARRLSEVKAIHGAQALAGFSSAKCTNEENYLFQKWVRACLGTPHIDHCTRLCHSSSVYALQTALGTGSMTNAISDIGDAQVMVVTGSNTTENHPVLATFIKQNAKRGAKLIVIDPRRIPIARHAWLHLQPNPGTDVALYNAMMRLIIARGLVDEAFVRANTEGFEELRSAVEPYTLELAERITGVPAAGIEKAALAYGRAERAAIYWGMGISQHTTGSDNSFCLIDLALLTGNVGKRGVGLNPLRGQNNVQGASDMGAIPMYYPGYEPADDPDVRDRFARAWGIDEAPASGMTVTEIMKAVPKGGIRALYIMGENPIISDPDINHVEECVRALEFLAVQDIFLTETAEYADVVLPAASGLEKEGTYANTDRHVQLGKPVLEPPGQSRQDWDIICELSTRMGYPMPYRGVAEVQDEIRKLVPDYAGITHERIQRENVQWPARSEREPGMAIYERIPRGKGLLRPAEWLPAKELPDGTFPYVLNTGRVLEHWHTGTMTRRSKVLDGISPEPFVEMNEEDAARERLRDGEMVRVVSRRGELACRLKATRRMLRNTVFIPFHYREAAANLLTIDALDPYAKIPEFKFCAVRVERAR